MQAARPQVARKVREQALSESKTMGSEPSPRQYPYLPCGYEPERRERYLEWLASATAGEDGSTSDSCQERFEVLLGVWAGFLPSNPIDWWPVYEGLAPGDIAVLRLADTYVPDWVRDGRAASATEPTASGLDAPAPSLPQGPELDGLLEAAASVLVPPKELPNSEKGSDEERYRLPPHEVFAESAFVAGLGPVGLGLVLGEPETSGVTGYLTAPVGMFLPFPVDLFDSMLDPTVHDGEWFAGFSVSDTSGVECPARASIPERAEHVSLSFLTESEFQSFISWIISEFDREGWFASGLDQLEVASQRLRAGHEASSDPETEEEEPWDTWELRSPSSDEQVATQWGVGSLDLQARERLICGLGRLLDLSGAEHESVKRLRYELKRFREATSAPAREVAERSLLLTGAAGQHAPEEKVRGKSPLLPVAPLLVPVWDHQVEVFDQVIAALERGPVPRQRVERRVLPNQRTSVWNAAADDLALLALFWTRAALAAEPRANLSMLTIPCSGSVFGSLERAWRDADEALVAASFASEESVNTGELVDIRDLVQGYTADFRASPGFFPLQIGIDFWNNPAHARGRSRLVPIEASEAVACWEASNSIGTDGVYVRLETLDEVMPDYEPDWATEVLGLEAFSHLDNDRGEMLAKLSLGPDGVRRELEALSERARAILD